MIIIYCVKPKLLRQDLPFNPANPPITPPTTKVTKLNATREPRNGNNKAIFSVIDPTKTSDLINNMIAQKSIIENAPTKNDLPYDILKKNAKSKGPTKINHQGPI